MSNVASGNCRIITTFFLEVILQTLLVFFEISVNCMVFKYVDTGQPGVYCML
jgi:hypothetical protein